VLPTEDSSRTHSQNRMRNANEHCGTSNVPLFAPPATTLRRWAAWQRGSAGPAPKGIANHSTGDLNGLAVGLSSKPGMEIESWLGVRGRAPFLFSLDCSLLNFL
jgi:hypothetical protein